jgi:glycosyltransferase involved in cell wall biosynthesis
MDRSIETSNSRLISVIVPAYNLESYISRCIESILAQTHRELEVIVVDDCSSDRTGEIIAEFASSDSRVKVVRQPENRGLHAARIAGLEMSSGTRIGFVDGDDWIAPGMYESMWLTAECEAADIVLCGATIATAPGELLGPKVRFGKRNVFDGDLLGRFCRLQFGSAVIWNKLFRADLIRPHLLRNLERRVDTGADYIVGFGCFADASRVAVIPQSHYFYFYRPDSMSRADANGANFAVTLRCYVVCLETYARDNPSHASLIDQLYSCQLRMRCYWIEKAADLDPFRESLAESLRRLAALHPAGAYAMVHVFDHAYSQNRIGLRSALWQLRAAVKDLVQACANRLATGRRS